MLRPEAKRTLNELNLNLMDEIWIDEETGMPTVEKCDYIPTRLIAFDKAKRSCVHDGMVHFYLEDYAFNRIWNKPMTQIGVLSKYEGIASPDFSVYFDMPKPLIIWQIYKRRLLSQWYQRMGMNVVYNIQTIGEQYDKYQFAGVEKGGVLIARTPLQYKGNKVGRLEFIRTLHKANEELQPHTFLLYGYTGDKKDLPSNINFKFYDNDNIRIRRANAR